VIVISLGVIHCGRVHAYWYVCCAWLSSVGACLLARSFQRHPFSGVFEAACITSFVLQLCVVAGARGHGSRVSAQRCNAASRPSAPRDASTTAVASHSTTPTLPPSSRRYHGCQAPAWHPPTATHRPVAWGCHVAALVTREVHRRGCVRGLRSGPPSGYRPWHQRRHWHQCHWRSITCLPALPCVTWPRRRAATTSHTDTPARGYASDHRHRHGGRWGGCRAIKCQITSPQPPITNCSQ